MEEELQLTTASKEGERGEWLKNVETSIQNNRTAIETETVRARALLEQSAACTSTLTTLATSLQVLLVDTSNKTAALEGWLVTATELQELRITKEADIQVLLQSTRDTLTLYEAALGDGIALHMETAECESTERTAFTDNITDHVPDAFTSGAIQSCIDEVTRIESAIDNQRNTATVCNEKLLAQNNDLPILAAALHAMLTTTIVAMEEEMVATTATKEGEHGEWLKNVDISIQENRAAIEKEKDRATTVLEQSAACKGTMDVVLPLLQELSAAAVDKLIVLGAHLTEADAMNTASAAQVLQMKQDVIEYQKIFQNSHWTQVDAQNPINAQVSPACFFSKIFLVQCFFFVCFCCWIVF